MMELSLLCNPTRLCTALTASLSENNPKPLRAAMNGLSQEITNLYTIPCLGMQLKLRFIHHVSPCNPTRTQSLHHLQSLSASSRQESPLKNKVEALTDYRKYATAAN